MKRIATVSASIVVLAVAMTAFWNAGPNCSCCAVAPVTAPAADEAALPVYDWPDDAALPCQDDPNGEAMTIDDRRIMREIERLATQLIENKQHTPMAELKAQMESRARARVALPPAQVEPMTSSEMFAQRADSVLVVAHVYNCGRCERWHTGATSGVALTADGIGATNYHVLEQDNAETMVVATRDGRVFAMKEVLAASKADDLAIFRIEAEGLTAAPLRGDVPIGTPARVISHPSRRFYTYTEGIVSRYFLSRRPGQNQPVPMVSVTADFARGSSGAPVFDDAGNVIGLVCSTQSMYYSVEDGVQKNLQMVFKQCVPGRSLLERIDAPE